MLPVLYSPNETGIFSRLFYLLPPGSGSMRHIFMRIRIRNTAFVSIEKVIFTFT